MPDIPAAPPIVSPSVFTPTPIAPSTKKSYRWLIVTLIIFLLAAASVFAYKYWQVKQQLSQIQSLPTPTPSTVIISTEDDTTAWQTYSNQEIGFSIKYPQGWREQEWTGGVGFGPKEIGEDVLFGINFYEKSTTDIQGIASKIGSQFADRKETITTNKIIVTTPSYPDWYSETIIYETTNWYIAVGNGAIKDENLPFDRGVPAGLTFERFYSTFKFTEN